MVDKQLIRPYIFSGVCVALGGWVDSHDLIGLRIWVVQETNTNNILIGWK